MTSCLYTNPLLKKEKEEKESILKERIGSVPFRSKVPAKKGSTLKGKMLNPVRATFEKTSLKKGGKFNFELPPTPASVATPLKKMINMEFL